MTKPPESAGAPRRPSAGSFLLLHISFLIYSFGSVFAKTAAVSGLLTPRFLLFAFFELLTLCVYALLWQQTLSRFKLTTAFANKGVVVIWNLIWAALLFGERITPENLIGTTLVIVGIVVVSSDAR